MPRNFSRHEQFLRIFALLELLSTTRQPLDDQSLIAAIRERLGLSRLSTRTLHRDCEFLVSCGYPINHAPLQGDRRYGWQLAKEGMAGRQIPPEPLTLLELVAFMIGRDLLRPFEGTVLWTGIESLRHKLERGLSPELLKRLADSKNVFQVDKPDLSRYAARPRLISTLSAAITDCREIDIEQRPDAGKKPVRLRLQPHRIVVRPPKVSLLGFSPDGANDVAPLLLDIEQIEKVTVRDATFVPRDIDSDTLSG